MCKIRKALIIIITLVIPVLLISVGLSILGGVFPLKTVLADSSLIPGKEALHLVEKKETFAPDQFIVKFNKDIKPTKGIKDILQTGSPELDDIMVVHGVYKTNKLFKELKSQSNHPLSNIYLLKLKPNSNTLRAIEAFEKNPHVEWAEPDYLAYPADTIPDDTHFSDQWGLTKIQAEVAWDVVTGNETVAIAILDSGVDKTHPDLSGKLWINPGEIAGNSIDDDNNGYVDDVNGWDFVHSDNNPSDDNGHGTQVAGVAAAATNNSNGIAGVCWNCKIMPVKVMQVSGVANYSDIAAGVVYAAEKGAKVINISLGGYSYSNALQTAIQTAVDIYGSVVVAGAGNDNLSTPFYPAAYEEVMAVAGTDNVDSKSGLSNYGTWVDVSAPAVNITTTFMGGDYGLANGTSFAAPFVSGLAGLIRSQHPGWNQALVKSQIDHTSDAIDSLNPTYAGELGSGRINANKAVTVAAKPLLSISSTTVNGVPNGRPSPGATATLELTLFNDWLDATGVTGVLSTSDPKVTITQNTSSYGDIAAGGTGTGNPVYRISVASAAGYNHPIAFTLNVNANGGSYTTAIAFTIITRSSNENVSGTIGSDTLWTSDKTYIVKNHIGIAPGITLTIQPGTEIHFDGDYNFNVGGTLIADGNEALPIRFRHQSDGEWGRINFENTSVDAAADVSGNYQTGNILRWVQVEGASNGSIQCDGATPYLSHITLASSGISCLPGSTKLWLQESDIAGEVHIHGASVVRNNAFTGGSSNEISGINVGNNSVVKFNTFEVSIGSTGWAIISSGTVTITNNRVVGGENGIWVNVGGGLVSENLIANNSGIGMKINGDATIISNTLTGNAGSAIKLENANSLNITGNNLEGNLGTYDIENLIPNTTLAAVLAQNNWWGTTNNAAIAQRIWDWNDDFNMGVVDFTPRLGQPVSSAPAYVRSVTLTPESPVGIQTVTFDVDFSRKMNTNDYPDVSFYTSKRGTWKNYNSTNSDLPNDGLTSIAICDDGSKWFGSFNGIARFHNNKWTIYNETNSGLPSNQVESLSCEDNNKLWVGTTYAGIASYDGSNWEVYNPSNFLSNVIAIAIDNNGTKWFSIAGEGVARFNDSEWTIYNTSNSGLPADTIYAIAFEKDGTAWFGTDVVGVASYDGSKWAFYDTSNSGFPGDIVLSIAVDKNDIVWIGTNDFGLASFDGNNWNVYNVSSNLACPFHTIAVDNDNVKWFGGSGIYSYDGNEWKHYDILNSGIPVDIYTIAVDENFDKWISTNSEDGVYVLYGGKDYLINENQGWESPTRFRATYDMNSLISRDTYKVSVSGVLGEDNIEIPLNEASTFTVDYAGAISDITPPPKPQVTACAGSSIGTLYAHWSASDPDSSITLYQYAIGTSSGGSDVVNWTNTTETSFVRTELNLVAGQTYFISVKARNDGGLWSEASTPPGVVAGSGTCTNTFRYTYLPVIFKNYSD